MSAKPDKFQRTLKVDFGYVHSVAISPDGKIVSGAIAGNNLKIWQISP